MGKKSVVHQSGLVKPTFVFHNNRSRPFGERCWHVAKPLSFGKDEEETPMAKSEVASMTNTVKTAIQDSGMSLNALARATGVQVSSLSRFMRGEQDLVFGAVQSLAAVLGLRLVQDTSAGKSSGKKDTKK
jgi:ribosome-binding protein aMBF1 (putative translation factor)